MCGIIGVLSKGPVNQAIYDGLLVLQPRGQDAAGILTSDGNRVYLRKDNGLVRDVFQQRHMASLKGPMGIGHVRYLTAGSDSEVLLNVFAHELRAVATLKLTPEHIFRAVSAVHRRVKGAYAVTILIAGHGILAFRDPHGIRPLIYGKRETDLGPEHMFASESVALDAPGFELVRDVGPGEAIFIDMSGRK